MLGKKKGGVGGLSDEVWDWTMRKFRKQTDMRTGK
jgi:hypothetical protein